METTKDPVQVHLTPYRNSLAGDGRDAMPITVEVVDSKGRHVPTADNMMEFTLTGPAEIIGLGNGNPNCHEPEKGNKRSLFYGLAQVIIQSKEGSGPITLTASTPGLKPATITINAEEVAPVPFVAPEFPPMLLNRWVASPLSTDKPDANQQIADNDMNSWQPVSSGNLIKLENANFVILRATFNPYQAHREEGGSILFKQLTGKAEIWLNGQLIGSKTTDNAEDFTVEFPAVKDKCDLRVLLNGSTGDAVGVKGNVTIRTKRIIP